MPTNSIWDKRELPYLKVGSVYFTHFADDQLPLAVISQASLEFTQLGLGYATGPARKQRKIWNVSAYVDQTQWSDLLSVFNSWDAQRATGSNTATVTVVDGLLGSSITTKAFFTDNPTLTKVAPGNNVIFIVNFALTEV